MNTLNLIKKQIEKASALHDAQISHTAYRGVEYKIQDRANKQSERKYLSTTYRGIQTQTQVEVVK